MNILILDEGKYRNTIAEVLLFCKDGLIVKTNDKSEYFLFNHEYKSLKYYNEYHIQYSPYYVTDISGNIVRCFSSNIEEQYKYYCYVCNKTSSLDTITQTLKCCKIALEKIHFHYNELPKVAIIKRYL